MVTQTIWNKEEFSESFSNTPVLPVDTTKNQIVIADIGQENKHRMIAKLLTIVLKWDKRIN